MVEGRGRLCRARGLRYDVAPQRCIDILTADKDMTKFCMYQIIRTKLRFFYTYKIKGGDSHPPFPTSSYHNLTPWMSFSWSSWCPAQRLEQVQRYEFPGAMSCQVSARPANQCQNLLP